MWDVIRYAELHAPAAIIVENVVEAANWIFYPAWRMALEAAGYTVKICSVNSMHTGAVPQSRDRIYVVAVRRGLAVDLDLRPLAYCHPATSDIDAYQSWKPGRVVGRYRQQYLWRCPGCHQPVEPYALPAAVAIDWELPSQRIGERKRPLAAATLRRIHLGLLRYGYTIVAGAGQTWERPGSRLRPGLAPRPAPPRPDRHPPTRPAPTPAERVHRRAARRRQPNQDAPRHPPAGHRRSQRQPPRPGLPAPGGRDRPHRPQPAGSAASASPSGP